MEIDTENRRKDYYSNHSVLVACTNANGEGDIFSCRVNVTPDEYANGIHYNKAEELAEAAGFSFPFVCFDEVEQPNLYRGILGSSALVSTPGTPKNLQELIALLMGVVPIGHVAVFKGHYTWVESDRNGITSLYALSIGNPLALTLKWDDFNHVHNSGIIDSLEEWLKTYESIPMREMQLS